MKLYFKLVIFVFVLTLMPFKLELKTQDLTLFDHNHSDLNFLLNTHVKDGNFDYKSFIESQKLFNNYLDSLAKVNEEQYQTWNDQQKLAFWINSYNAFTIKAIIDNYPIERSWTLIGIFYAPKNSILQIPGVWKKLTFQAVNKIVTLDDIEHKILRKDFKEPRIHFAINCASKGCPDIKSESYKANIIDEQLSEAAHSFINNKNKGVLFDEDGKKIKISKIFKWFGRDFLSHYEEEYFSNRSINNKGVLGVILKYIDSEESKNILKSNNFDISYMKYDWSLNESS